MSIDLGLRTTTGKLLLFYTAAFGAIALIAIAIIHAHWTQLSLREVRAALSEQSAGLGDVFRDEGVDGLRREIERRDRVRFDPEALYALWSPRGQLITGNISPQLSLPEVGVEEIQLTLSADETVGAPAHAAIAVIERLSDGTVLLVGRDVEARLELREETLRLVRWTLAAVALLGIGGALFGGRRVLRQIDAVATTTRRIAAGDLEHRVPVRGSGDEFDRLAIAINLMLERIAELNVGMQTVIDSVAHDLRRPLTHARQSLEAAMAGVGQSGGADLADAQDALDQIQRTLDALLHIVQADAGVNASQMELCAIDAIARDVAELYEPVAQAQGLRLLLEAQPQSIRGHRQLLAQAISNLIDNAIKYAPGSGDIAILVDADEEKLRISISDRGGGIPVDQRQRVVGRFVRLVGQAEVPGSGLGLSLVASVARLHGGALILTDAGPGLRATLELPLNPAA